MLKQYYPSVELGIIGACVAGSVLIERLLLPAAIVVISILAFRILLYRSWIRTPTDWAIAGLVLMLPITLWASALPDKTLLQVCRLITGIGLFYAIVDWSTTNDKVKMLFLLLPVTTIRYRQSEARRLQAMDLANLPGQGSADER